jgi:hypothetical protein
MDGRRFDERTKVATMAVLSFALLQQRWRCNVAALQLATALQLAAALQRCTSRRCGVAALHLTTLWRCSSRRRCNVAARDAAALQLVAAL